ncbi:antibiotic biosynthesis monooxygenase family protein [Actinomadura sp. GTD37]|uniref:antibiotic biosynthesis monooxygenase family protein n=1 Tax=Actinomadura sp. GTD37 TaxID=1778030 RepID=UPI0035BF29EC
MSKSPVRVVVHYRDPRGPTGAVTAAYEQAGRTLRGTPGLIGHELLAVQEGDGRYALMMAWRDLASYRDWERSLRAAGHPSPLRAYQDRTRPAGHYEVYEVHDAWYEAAGRTGPAAVPDPPA